MDIYTFVMQNLQKLTRIISDIPLSFFKSDSNSNLYVFFAVAFSAGLVFLAMWERWLKS